MSNLIGNLLGGGGGSAPPVAPEQPDPPTPVDTPIVFGDEAYYDHMDRAVNRLCQQFRSDE